MRKTLAAIAVLALAAGSCGGPAELNVADAWARAAVGPNGAVYLTIDGGESGTSLSSASVSPDVATAVELHQTVIRENGVMGMTQVSKVEIPADSTVMMVPGGLHVMLINLKGPLEHGDTFDLNLAFDDGTELLTTVEVRDE